MMARLAAFFILGSLQVAPAFAGFQDDAGTHSLSGVVVTHAGIPAPNIHVLIQGVYPPATLHTLVVTDEQGHYRADKLMPGQYVVYPYGEYPGFIIRNDMFDDPNPERVMITEEHANIVKNLRMPLEMAVIHGQLTSHSGVPVTGAKIVFCRAHDASNSAGTITDGKGRFGYIVPSELDFSILVLGSTGIKMQQTGVSFKPGEDRKLILSLDKDSKIKGSMCGPVPGSHP